MVDGNDNIDPNEYHDITHRKVTKLWLKRFKFAFCCVAKDEFGDEAFTQSAELFSHIFRGTDLVPSGLHCKFLTKTSTINVLFHNPQDLLAGFILLRVRQKKEQRELQRIHMLNDASPRYSSDLPRVFNAQCPQWMTLRNAQHYLRFAVSSYGWPMVCAIAPCRGCFGMIRKVTCCACLRFENAFMTLITMSSFVLIYRKRRTQVVDDNCCQCNVAGTRFASRIHNDDVIYASFKNQVFEVSVTD